MAHSLLFQKKKKCYQWLVRTELSGCHTRLLPFGSLFFFFFFFRGLLLSVGAHKYCMAKGKVPSQVSLLRQALHSFLAAFLPLTMVTVLLHNLALHSTSRGGLEKKSAFNVRVNRLRAAAAALSPPLL